MYHMQATGVYCMTKEELLAILIAIWEDGADDLFPMTDADEVASIIEAQGRLAYQYIREYLLTLTSEDIVDEKWADGNGLEDFIQGMILRIISFITEHFGEDKLKEILIAFETWNGERIVDTEETRCNAQEFLKSHDYYVYHCIVDDRTCKDCLDLNGKTFLREDAVIGVNCPPMHPRCRCWIDES